MKTLLLYGLRRSGNHYLLSLILQQFKNYVHINNAWITYENYNKYKNIEKTQVRIDCQWTGFKNVDCIVLSMENKEIYDDEIEKIKCENNDVHTILLLRNPYCNLSSAWKSYDSDEERMNELIIMWQTYSKIFLDHNDNKIKILYDEFCTNKEYKYHIFKKIGIDISVIDENKTIKWQESSFDAPDEKKYSQQVYKKLEETVYFNDENFTSLFKNTEIHYLWNKILKQFNR